MECLQVIFSSVNLWTPEHRIQSRTVLPVKLKNGIILVRDCHNLRDSVYSCFITDSLCTTSRFLPCHHVTTKWSQT